MKIVAIYMVAIFMCLKPEYGLGNKVSIYGDTYSFGVLLLEIFTGKRPTDADFAQDLSLHRYEQIALRDHQVASVIDEQLRRK